MAERLTTRDMKGRAIISVKKPKIDGEIKAVHNALDEIIEKIARYEDLEEAGRLVELPCKIGDMVYGIRRWYGTNIAKAGPVSEMFYTQNGKLMIVIKNVCRGHWGDKIFATLEEAEAALKGAEQ